MAEEILVANFNSQRKHISDMVWHSRIVLSSLLFGNENFYKKGLNLSKQEIRFFFNDEINNALTTRGVRRFYSGYPYDY